jgi:hypothetical protein
MSINSKQKYLFSIALFLFFLLCPLIGFSAEAAETTIVVIPINMIFPLVPSTTIISDYSSIEQGTSAGIITSIDGILGIMRTSISD